MSTAKKTIWLFTLALFSGGCSSYKAVSPPPQFEAPGTSDESAFPLKVGDEVQVTLNNDGVAKGKVRSATSGQITLEIDTCNEQFEAVGTEDELVQIPMETIQFIEKRCFSPGKTVALFVGIALPLVAIGATYESPSFSFEDGDWGSIGPCQYSPVRPR